LTKRRRCRNPVLTSLTVLLETAAAGAAITNHRTEPTAAVRVSSKKAPMCFPSDIADDGNGTHGRNKMTKLSSSA